jgi:hypothetical protein
MEKVNKFYVLLLLTCLGFYSCTKPEALNIKEYIKWVHAPENGLLTSNKVDDYEFQVMYKPVDYIIASEIKNSILKQTEVLKRKSDLQGFQYYTVKIKAKNDNEVLKAGISNENEYFERLEYFTENAQNDIFLIDGKDTLSSVLYHFERNYGLSPLNTIILAFENKFPDKIRDRVLVYDDVVLGTGKVSLAIKSEDIKRVPHLILQ